MADVIKNGDLVYLSLDDGPEQSIATVYTGVKYWFPTVSSSKVKLVLSFEGPHGQELTEGAYVHLTATEPRVGENMRLSAYLLDDNCYYWNADTTHQQWQIHSCDSQDGKVRYGDGVTLTNIAWSPQRLVPKDGYLTTKAVGDSDSTWVVAKA